MLPPPAPPPALAPALFASAPAHNVCELPPRRQQRRLRHHVCNPLGLLAQRHVCVARRLTRRGCQLRLALQQHLGAGNGGVAIAGQRLQTRVQCWVCMRACTRMHTQLRHSGGAVPASKTAANAPAAAAQSHSTACHARCAAAAGHACWPTTAAHAATAPARRLHACKAGRGASVTVPLCAVHSTTRCSLLRHMQPAAAAARHRTATRSMLTRTWEEGGGGDVCRRRRLQAGVRQALLQLAACEQPLHKVAPLVLVHNTKVLERLWVSVWRSALMRAQWQGRQCT